jgi:adenosylcobinamide kinase/adenosylcobinamide-phosphate guanylyltransferase
MVSCLFYSRSVPDGFYASAQGAMQMQQGSTNSVTLVLGGVRSGKSRYAHQLAERAARVTFIATAERRDDEEMLQKIERHRAERPDHWATIEEPLQLAHAIQAACAQSDAILVDCLTFYAANLLETHGEDPVTLRHEIEKLCAVLGTVPCAVVLVSNEVGSGVVPPYVSGRRFRDLVGELNQRVAAVASNVVLMVAGLPLPLKIPANSEVRP